MREIYILTKFVVRVATCLLATLVQIKMPLVVVVEVVVYLQCEYVTIWYSGCTVK